MALDLDSNPNECLEINCSHGKVSIQGGLDGYELTSFLCDLITLDNVGLERALLITSQLELPFRLAICDEQLSLQGLCAAEPDIVPAVKQLLELSQAVQGWLTEPVSESQSDETASELLPDFDSELLEVFRSCPSFNSEALVEFEGIDVGLDLDERLILFLRVAENLVYWWAPLDSAPQQVKQLLELNRIERLGAQCALSLDDDGQVLMLEGYVSMQTIRVDCVEAVDAILAKVDSIVGVVDGIEESSSGRPNSSNFDYV